MERNEVSQEARVLCLIEKGNINLEQEWSVRQGTIKIVISIVAVLRYIPEAAPSSKNGTLATD
jgi:hypothetical protein